jgi:predicted metal-binding membrane protein
MASASNVLGGAILIAAGVYQWTPLKDVCLTQCQSPLLFLMRHGGFRRDAFGCLLLRLRHGAYEAFSIRALDRACCSALRFSLQERGCYFLEMA